MSEARDPVSVRGRWLRWAGAIALVVVGSATVQFLLHGFLMGTEMLIRHIVSGLLQAVIVLVPVIMYLGWRRAAEREADVSRKLRVSERLREDLVNMLIHDLKGPAVTAGMALNALARSESANADRGEQDGELLQIARDSVGRLEHMIGDMLDAATAEAGALSLNIGDIDLASLARAAVQDIALQSEERKIHVRGPSLKDVIPLRADEQRVRRVIDNLLLNAVKFTPADGDVEVLVASSDEEAQVTVRDSGPGVPRHVREHIFEKYGQADDSSGDRMSVGLGLAFCRLVVEAHGGRIWVDFEPGHGNAFTFALPLQGPQDPIRKKGLRRLTGKGGEALLRI
ncbi:MAG: ATP-binding protein [Candidatus Eisenbacteria bacterium]